MQSMTILSKGHMYVKTPASAVPRLIRLPLPFPPGLAICLIIFSVYIPVYSYLVQYSKDPRHLLLWCSYLAICEQTCDTPKLNLIQTTEKDVTAIITSLDPVIVSWFADDTLVKYGTVGAGYQQNMTVDTNTTQLVRVSVTNIVTGQRVTQSIILEQNWDNDGEDEDGIESGTADNDKYDDDDKYQRKRNYIIALPVILGFVIILAAITFLIRRTRTPSHMIPIQNRPDTAAVPSYQGSSVEPPTQQSYTTVFRTLHMFHRNLINFTAVVKFQKDLTQPFPRDRVILFEHLIQNSPILILHHGFVIQSMIILSKGHMYVKTPASAVPRLIRLLAPTLSPRPSYMFDYLKWLRSCIYSYLTVTTRPLSSTFLFIITRRTNRSGEIS
eukprot:sb/3465605/